MSSQATLLLIPSNLRSVLSRYESDDYMAFMIVYFLCIFSCVFICMPHLPGSICALELALFIVISAAPTISAGDVRTFNRIHPFHGNLNTAELPAPNRSTFSYAVFSTFGLYIPFLAAALLGGGAGRRWTFRVTLAVDDFLPGFFVSPESGRTKPAEPIEVLSNNPSPNETHQLVLAARLALPLVLAVIFVVLPSLFFGHQIQVAFFVSKIYWFSISAYTSSSLGTVRGTHLRLDLLQWTCFALCFVATLLAQIQRTIVELEPSAPAWDLLWVWKFLVLCAAAAFCDGWAWMCAESLSSPHRALWVRVCAP
ncbi:hypothetical protein C8F01DRAFT_1368251, partial [Mycena amicta]